MTGNGTTAIHGLYRVEGDVLTLCYREPGDRPVVFESRRGTAVYLMVLKRAKRK